MRAWGKRFFCATLPHTHTLARPRGPPLAAFDGQTLFVAFLFSWVVKIDPPWRVSGDPKNLILGHDGLVINRLS